MDSALVDSVPSGWRSAVLGEIAEVVSGGTPPRAVPQYWGGPIPWATPTEVSSPSMRCLRSTRETITQEGADAAGLRILPVGSVLVTTRATIGAVARVGVAMTTNQGFQSLVPLDGTDAHWLFHVLRASSKRLHALAAGSTFKEVSRDSFRRLTILVAPPPEQRAIAASLDSIDEAIECSEEVTTSIERLQNALLRNLLAHGLPPIHANGRDAKAAPGGWTRTRLGELATFTNGRHFGPEDWSDQGLPIVRIQNLTNPDSPYNYFGGQPDARFRVRPGALLVPWSASLGVHIWTGPEAVLNQHIFRVDENGEVIDRRFLFFALHGAMDGIRRRVQGGTMKHITRKPFLSTPIMLPPMPEQIAIADVLESVSASRDTNAEWLTWLRRLRTELRASLLSGTVKIRVSTHERAEGTGRVSSNPPTA